MKGRIIYWWSPQSGNLPRHDLCDLYESADIKQASEYNSELLDTVVSVLMISLTYMAGTFRVRCLLA